ncbi:hypothetical protein LPJ73_007954, partial [Coemansia sp. RSA 2703]
ILSGEHGTATSMVFGKRFNTWKARLLWSGHGWCNIVTLALLFIALLFMFIGLPILSHYHWGHTTKNKSEAPISDYDVLIYGIARNTTSVGQPLVPKTLPIDPDSPTGLTWTSATKKKWKLVFSDEFEKEGRSFAAGEDKTWEAMDLWYWPTRDLEWYDPNHVTTKGGSLRLTVERNESHAGLPYTSGMLQSWNKQ